MKIKNATGEAVASAISSKEVFRVGANLDTVTSSTVVFIIQIIDSNGSTVDIRMVNGSRVYVDPPQEPDKPTIIPPKPTINPVWVINEFPAPEQPKAEEKPDPATQTKSPSRPLNEFYVPFDFIYTLDGFEFTIIVEESQEVPDSIPIPYYENYTFNLFMWDSLEDTPGALSDSIEIPVDGLIGDCACVHLNISMNDNNPKFQPYQSGKIEVGLKGDWRMICNEKPGKCKTTLILSGEGQLEVQGGKETTQTYVKLAAEQNQITCTAPSCKINNGKINMLLTGQLTSGGKPFSLTGKTIKSGTIEISIETGCNRDFKMKLEIENDKVNQDKSDFDGDGLNNSDEKKSKPPTNPQETDSDKDGVPDDSDGSPQDKNKQ
jgi:hypothetical protein